MDETATDKFFIFAHGGVQYALPVLQVLEIVRLGDLLPPPGGMPACLGNVSHRGHLVPVLDPTALAGGRAAAGATAAETFVVVRHAGATAGLAMDGFVSVAPLDGRSDPDGSDPDGGPPRGAGDFVEESRAYRDHGLVLLSTDAIARLVKRHFTSQVTIGGDPGALVRRASSTAAFEGDIYLSARIGPVLFGIPVGHVIEIVEGYDVTPLFKVPPILRGLINLRGQVLACLDISGDLGLPPRPLGERDHFVVLKVEDAELALCVDRVTGIRRLAADRVQRSESILTGEVNRFASGTHEGDDGTLFVMSVAAVFDAPALQPFRRADP